VIFASMPKIDSQAASWKGRHFLKALQSPQHRRHQQGHLLVGSAASSSLLEKSISFTAPPLE
jgi:hypothetical protein